MVLINIPMINIILMILIDMVIKNQVKLKLANQNLLKIKKEKDM